MLNTTDLLIKEGKNLKPKEEEKCPDCGSQLVEYHEMRGEVGMFEVFNECLSCGWTESGEV